MKIPISLNWLRLLNATEINEFNINQEIMIQESIYLNKPLVSEKKKQKLDIIIGECNIYDLLSEEIVTNNVGYVKYRLDELIYNRRLVEI